MCQNETQANHANMVLCFVFLIVHTDSLFIIFSFYSFDICFTDSAMQIIPFLEIPLFEGKVTLDFALGLTSPLNQDLIMSGFSLKTNNLNYTPTGPSLCTILNASFDDCHKETSNLKLLGRLPLHFSVSIRAVA